jgi:prenyltransferase beta subunit
MWTRRQILVRGAAASLALAAGSRPSWATPVPNREEEEVRKLITRVVRDAVEAGLQHLAKGQTPEGCFGTTGYRGNVGVTSLAGLAFLAAGHEADASPRGKVLGKALEYVLGQENRTGRYPGFLHNPQATPHGPRYGHGFGTLFLASLRGKVKEKEQAARGREILDRAVKLILDSQNKEGGWRYLPSSKDADSTVTACVMTALAAARQAGVKVPKKTTEAGVGYLKKCFTPASGGFQYMVGGDGTGPQFFARTAAAVAVLQAMGIRKGEEVEKGLAFLVENTPAPAVRPDMHYFYGHYYAARAMHARGGKPWKTWYSAVSKELLERQNADGSWQDPIDWHYGTAMACLVLLEPEARLAVKAGE